MPKTSFFLNFCCILLITLLSHSSAGYNYSYTDDISQKRKVQGSGNGEYTSEIFHLIMFMCFLNLYYI